MYKRQLQIRLRQFDVGRWTFFLVLHHQGQGLRHLALIEQLGGDPIPAIVLDFRKQSGHLREISGLVDFAERLHWVSVFFRVLLLEVVLIVGRHDLDADGADGDVLVDQNLIRFIPAEDVYKRQM